MKDGLFKTHLHAWLKLLRAPNLFTVPGDPIAGFLLAGGASDSGTIALVALASLAAYMFGLVGNDIADLEEDSRERPYRPLPSGEVRLTHAKIAASYLALAAAVLAGCAGISSFACCLMLLTAISLYNFNRKFRSLAGPAALAFCRAASVLLGASAAESVNWQWHGISPDLVGAAAIFVYILGVSLAAKGETKQLPERPGRRRLLTGALICGVFSTWMAAANAHAQGMSDSSTASLCLASLSSLILVLETARHFKAMGSAISPKETQGRIGSLIGLLIFAQVALCAAAGSVIWPVILLAMAPIAKASAAKFYGS